MDKMILALSALSEKMAEENVDAAGNEYENVAGKTDVDDGYDDQEES